MKIFINADEFKDIAIQTKEILINHIEKTDFKITNDIDNADLIFSIGGDGTFLKSAGMSDEKPIIGINTGTIGYLTEINPGNISDALEDIENQNYIIEERMMVEGEIIKPDGEVIKISPALNEIAISKNTFGVVRFDAIVDGKLINSYTADGILVCTPTGSTAYNLSCGGPLVDPTAHILTLTPIAPHTIINRSIILADEATVDVKITELRDNTTSFVLSDGKPIEVFSGYTIRIKKSDKITKIVKLENRSFIDNIRENIS